MSRRPLATVRVLKLPHLHPGAIRIELECPASTTGYTQIPSGPVGLPVEVLITMTAFEHDAQCGACDTSGVHRQGSTEARAAVARLRGWLAMNGRRN
jgi:hypothetical protein